MDILSILIHVGLIWVLAVITPGANVLLTIDTSLKYNAASAFYSAFGVSSATLVWSFLGGSGLAVMFSVWPQLFGVAKLIGGCYLLYLGARQIYCARKLNRHPAFAEPRINQPPSNKVIFFRAFITSILNPKTGFFVVSLFSVALPVKMDFTLLIPVMLVMASITLFWHAFLVIVFTQPLAKNSYSRIEKTVNYVTGGLFTILGLKVMTF